MDETYSDYGPVCPYCNHQHRADDGPGYYDENLTEMDCDDCNRLFTVEVQKSTTWLCEAIDDGMEEDL